MKTLKTADLAIQILLAVIGILYGFITRDFYATFICCYLLLGGWQLLSFVVHLTNNKNLFFQKERTNYAKIIGWLLATGSLCWIITFLASPALLLLYLYALLAGSPFLAIWYMSICLREIKLMNKKELVHLK